VAPAEALAGWRRAGEEDPYQQFGVTPARSRPARWPVPGPAAPS